MVGVLVKFCDSFTGPVVAGAAMTLMACGADPSAPPVAEVGTGVERWEPLEAEATVFLIEGPQGGRHIIGNVRMEGMEPGTTRATAPTTRFDVFKVDGSRVSTDLPPFSEPFVETPDGSLTLPFGRYVFIDSPAAEIVDTIVEFKVELNDKQGHSAGDSRWVRIELYVP
jgi:hypothetical protein